jgi:hypothetical protein
MHTLSVKLPSAVRKGLLWIEGDLVRVKAGEMVGYTAKIDCVDMSTCLASAYMQESVLVENISLKPLMFPLSDLERKFVWGITFVCSITV